MENKLNKEVAYSLLSQWMHHHYTNHRPFGEMFKEIVDFLDDEGILAGSRPTPNWDKIDPFQWIKERCNRGVVNLVYDANRVPAYHFDANVTIDGVTFNTKHQPTPHAAVLKLCVQIWEKSRENVQKGVILTRSIFPFVDVTVAQNGLPKTFKINNMEVPVKDINLEFVVGELTEVTITFLTDDVKVTTLKYQKGTAPLNNVEFIFDSDGKTVLQCTVNGTLIDQHTYASYVVENDVHGHRKSADVTITFPANVKIVVLRK